MSLGLFPKLKIDGFLINVFAWGGGFGIKMYDVNQNNLIFTFKTKFTPN